MSAGTGLSLQDAEKGLLALVAEIPGRLQVAEDGTLLLVFPPAEPPSWVSRDPANREGSAAMAAGVDDAIPAALR